MALAADDAAVLAYACGARILWRNGTNSVVQQKDENDDQQS
jgi:hypothetical protein